MLYFFLMNGTVSSLNPNRKHFGKRVINSVNICIQSRCDVHKHKWNIRRKNVYVCNHLDLQKAFLSIAPYRLWHTKAHTIPLYTKQYIVYQPHIVNVKGSLNNKSSMRPVSVCLILHCLEKSSVRYNS